MKIDAKQGETWARRKPTGGEWAGVLALYVVGAATIWPLALSGRRDLNELLALPFAVFLGLRGMWARPVARVDTALQGGGPAWVLNLNFWIIVLSGSLGPMLIGGTALVRFVLWLHDGTPYCVLTCSWFS